MVAVVAGNGLGLGDTSALILGGRGTVGDARVGRGNDRVYLNAATGNLVIQSRDELLLGRGLDVIAHRAYNSLGQFDFGNNDNWLSGLNKRIYGLTGTANTSGSTVLRADWDGTETIYAYNTSSARYETKAGDGAHDFLTLAGSTWTWTNGDTRVTETYDNASGGRITKQTDPSGNQITYTYNGTGQLTRVETPVTVGTTNTTESVYLDYSGTLLTQVRTVYKNASNTDVTRTRVRYEYDTSNRLSRVRVDLSPDDNSIATGTTYDTSYTYDGTSKRVASIVQSDGSRLDFVYTLVGADYRVTRITQTAASGVLRVTNIAYDTVNRTTTLTDPLGYATVFGYDASNRLTRITAPAVSGVSQTVQFGYDADGNVTSVTDAKGYVVTYQYNAQGLMTLQRDQAGNTVARSYNTNNQLDSETVYFTPDPDGAGSGLPGAPAVSRYLYDSVHRLRYLLSSEGRVTEYRYNSQGVRTSLHEYTADLYTGTTYTESALDSWRNGLVDKSRVMRTDYTYDYRGALASETRASRVRADGVASLDAYAAEYSTVRYVYDSFGNLLQRLPTAGSSSAEIYTYDGLGRALSSADLNGALTVTTFDDVNNQTRTTFADGLIRTRVYNRAGELISLLEGQGATTLSTTQYRYDALGRLRYSQDPTGVRTHVLYDAASRKVAEIDADGSLTEFFYDANNLGTRTLRYANKLSSAALAGLVDASGNPINVALGAAGSAVTTTSIPRPSADSSNDRNTWRLYDSANRLLKEVDARGAVVEYFYDGASRLVKTTAWANFINVTTFATTPTSANATPAVNASADRTTRYFYDNDGKLRGSLDGEGFIVEHRYNAAGQKTQTWRYADAAASADRAAAPLATLIANRGTTNRSSDITEHFLYDSRGLLRNYVDGEGNRTSYSYDQYGNVSSMIRGRRIDTSLLTTPQSVTIQFQARATVAGAIWPTVQVRVDGVVVGTVTISSATNTTYTVTATSVVPAAHHSIDFVYTNDDGIAGSTATSRSVWISNGSLRVGSYTQPFNGSANTALRDTGSGSAAFDGLTVTEASPWTEQLLDVNAALRFTTVSWSNDGFSTAAVALEATAYSYDAYGQLLNKTVTLAGGTTETDSYTYDSMRQRTGQSRAAWTSEERSSQVRYDVQGRVVMELGGRGVEALAALGGGPGSIGSPTQAQIDAVWNAWATKYSYDSAGRRVSMTDANGFKTLYYYNSDDKLVYTIRQSTDTTGTVFGEVLEYRYNAFNEVTDTLAYANRLSSTTFNGLTGGLVTTSVTNAVNAIANGAADARTQVVYNTTGTVQARREYTSASAYDTTTLGFNAFYEEITRTSPTESSSTVALNTGRDRRGLAVSTALDPSALNNTTATVYDAFGRIVQTTDGRGVIRKSTFDRSGRVVQVTDGNSQTESMTYDALGNVLTRTDRRGQVTTYAYEPFGRKLTVTTPEGIQTVTTYNPHGQVTRVQILGVAGNITDYTYDKDGNLKASTVASGSLNLTTTNNYDNAGRLASVVDPRGTTTTYAYDAANRVLTRTVDPSGLNLITRLAYDGRGQAVTVTDAGGTVTSTTFDAKGQKTQVAVDPTGLNLRTQFTYDKRGNALTVTEGAGTAEARVTQYTYDKAGRLTQTQIDPSGLNIRTNYTYDKNGNVTLKRDGNGNATRYLYDNENRLTHTVDATGAVSENVYDAAGNLTQTKRYANRIAQNGALRVSHLMGTNHSVSRYLGSFAAGDVVTVTVRFKATPGSEGRIFLGDAGGPDPYDNAVGVVLAGTRNGDGWQTLTTSLTLSHADQVWVYLYGGVWSSAENMGGKTTYDDLQISSTQRGTVLSDNFASLTLTSDVYSTSAWSPSGPTEQVFEVNLDPSALTDAQIKSAIVADATNDRVTSFAYDKDGRRVLERDALGGVTQFKYDAAGNVIQRTQFANRISTTAAPIVGGFSGVTLTADANLDRTTRFSYDEANRLKYTLDAHTVSGGPGGLITENVYDENGNVVRLIQWGNLYAAGKTIAGNPTAAQVAAILPALTNIAHADRIGAREQVFTYDRANRRVHTLNIWTANSTQKYFVASEQQYDALGRTVKTIGYANSILASDLATVPTTTAVSAKLAAVANAASDRVSQFLFDKAGRLTRSTDGEAFARTYTYDAVGNKLSFVNENGATWNYEYDKAGRLTIERSPTVTLASLSDSANGTATPSVSTTSGRVVTRMTYDALGNVVTRTEGLNNDLTSRAETRTTSYAYDALGRQTTIIYERVGLYDPAQDNLTYNGWNGSANVQVNRTESSVARYSDTKFNVFGEAIVNRDVAGGMSYKTYDRLGRLIYEVDPNRNVVQHDYAAKGVLSSETFTRMSGQAGILDPATVTEALISTAAAAASGTAGSNRHLLTTYDRLGRSTVIDEPVLAYTYDSATGQAGNWARKTTYDYNVFGDVTRARRLVNPNSGAYADTYFYYELHGKKWREIDALGYVTDTSINAFGDVTRTYEYAQALSAGGWSLTSAGAPVATTTQAAPSSAIGHDREVQHGYDRKGNKVSDVWVAVQFSRNPGDLSAERVVNHVVKTYTYDGAGNVVVQSDYTVDLGWTVATSGLAGYTPGNNVYSFFDALGRREVMVQSNGATVRSQYDALGNAVATTVHANATTVTWPSGPRPTGYTLAAASGNDQVTYQYFDRLGRTVRTVSPTGANAYFSYNARGDVAKEWRPFYDVYGSLRQAIRLFNYDATGRQTETKTLTQRYLDAAMTYASEAVRYNAFGEVTAKALDGVEYEFNDYDDAGRIWRSNAGDGVYKIYHYDLLGNLTRQIVSPTVNLKTQIGSPDLGAAVSDYNNYRVTTNVLDRRGRVLTQYVPMWTDFSGNGRAPWISRTFDRWDNVLTQSHLNNSGWITTYRYNALNQVILEQKPAVEVWTEQGTMYGANPTTTVYYDAWGHQIGVTDPNGRTNTRRYDGLGRLNSEYFADGGLITHGYDLQNREVSKTDQIGRLYTYAYDKANQRTEDWVTAGGVAYKLAGRRFDLMGNRISETTGQGDTYANATRNYLHDARGRVISVYGPLGYEGSFVYDARGNRTLEVDAAGAETRLTYDYFGRLIGKTDMGGATYTFVYNQAGQLTSQTNTRGQNLAYYYYANGQVRQINDNWRNSYSQYDFDFAGNRTRDIFVEDGSIYRYAFNSYDSSDRLTRVVDDNGGSEASSRYTLNYRYDANGNKRQVFGSYLQATGGRVNVDNVFAYDALNRVTVENGVFANGTVSLQDYRSYQYAYDAAGRRVSSRYKTPARNSPYGYGMTYGLSTAYTYDFADRVLRTYESTVDANGNLGYQRLRIETVYDPTNGRQTSYREGKVQKDMEGIPFVDRRYISDRFYDANGRLIDDIQWVEGAVMEGYVVSTATFNPDTNSYGWILSRTTYGYDAAGNLAGIRADAYKENEQSYSGYNPDTATNYSFKKFKNTSYVSSTYYQYTYAKMDGYRERYVSSTSTTAQPNTTYEMYDVNGQLLHTYQSLNPSYSAAWYVTDHAGHIVQKLALPGLVFNAMPDYAPEASAGAIPSQQARPHPTFLYVAPPAPPPPPPPPTLPPGPSWPDTWLFSGEALYVGGSIRSVSNIYRLDHQTDGNVVLYRNDTGIPVWWTGTNGQSTHYLHMRADGNLVLIGTDGQIKWQLGSNSPGARLAMQDQGNLVIYSTTDSVVWSTNTIGAGAPPAPAPAPPPPAPPPPPPPSGGGGGGGGGGKPIERIEPIDAFDNAVMASTTSLPALFKPALPPAPPPPAGAALLPPEFGLGTGDNEIELASNDLALSLIPPQSMSYAKPATPGSGYWQQFFFANDVGVGTRGYATYNMNIGSFDYTGLGKVQSSTENAATYTVRGTETLRDIARSIYGDETLWYVLAEANGLTAPDGLVAGTTLKVPSVTRASNTASTFKVYNAGEAIGSTAPDQIAPPPPPSSKGGCGGVGTVLVIVVAIVATVFTAGAAAIYFGAGAGMGSSALAAASVGEIFAAGGAALAGGGVVGVGAAAGVAIPVEITGGLAVGAAAVGGAAGSIAGQGVGVATGVQGGFSWKNVGLAALGAGVTSGIGALSGGAAAGNSASFLGISKADNGGMLYAATRSVANSLVTQGLGSALGLQAFEWKAIAVSAITSPLNAAINENGLNDLLKDTDSFVRDSVTSIVNGTIAQSVRMQVYSDGKVDWASIAGDAFGNAIGNSVIDALRPGGNQGTSAEPVDPTKRSQQAIDALTKEAEKYGGFDKIPNNSPVLRMAVESAKAGNEAVFALAKSGEAADGFAGPIMLASEGESWKDAARSVLRQGARDLAISGGVVAGMFQTVGDSLIGAGALVKDVLLAQQYMLGGGDNALNRFLPGFEMKQEAYQNVRALGQAVEEIARDPGRFIGNTIGKSIDNVATRLQVAQQTDELGDWFLYGASVGNVTMGVASVIAGAAGAARLATAGAREVTTLLRTRIDEFAPDVRANPVAPELSRGAPVPTNLPDSPNSPLEPYNRRKHYGVSPTAADRKLFGVGADEVLDHEPSLVRRYYDGDPDLGELPGWQMNDAQRRASANDRARMSPQPRPESDAQGATSANYSKQQKKKYGL